MAFAGIFLATSGLVFATASEASAQAAPTTTPTTAKPASSSAATLSFATTSPVLVQTDAATWRTNVVVTVSSTCPTTLSFWLVLPSTAVVPARAVSDAHPPCTTSNWQVLPETLTFGSLPGSPAAVTLVVGQYGPTTASTTSGGVATTQLTLQRILPSFDGLPFGWVIVAAGGLALLFLILAIASQAGRTGRRVNFSAPVYAAASWTFKDSWATNITVVGAVLGTFISTSGSVTSLFPGVPLYRFSLANVAVGALVVIVPLVVALLSALTKQSAAVKPQQGEAVVASFGAVLVGGTLTMFGVGAELTLFGILADVSGATSGWTAVFLAALALTALIVLAYALLATYKLKVAGDEVETKLRSRATFRSQLSANERFAFDQQESVTVDSPLARSADTSLTL